MTFGVISYKMSHSVLACRVHPKQNNNIVSQCQCVSIRMVVVGDATRQGENSRMAQLGQARISPNRKWNWESPKDFSSSPHSFVFRLLRFVFNWISNEKEENVIASRNRPWNAWNGRPTKWFCLGKTRVCMSTWCTNYKLFHVSMLRAKVACQIKLNWCQYNIGAAIHCVWEPRHRNFRSGNSFMVDQIKWR